MQAVNAILSPESTSDYEYLPFFYSRVFDLSWQVSLPRCALVPAASGAHAGP